MRIENRGCRGRRWNPLQQRSDSFACSVEQLVVASLTFTVALLLLPTTAVFHLFFATLHALISALATVLRLSIVALHTFPFYAVWLWGQSPSMFPSGLIFQPVGVEEDVRCRGGERGGGRSHSADADAVSVCHMAVRAATLGAWTPHGVTLRVCAHERDAGSRV